LLLLPVAAKLLLRDPRLRLLALPVHLLLRHPAMGLLAGGAHLALLDHARLRVLAIAMGRPLLGHGGVRVLRPGGSAAMSVTAAARLHRERMASATAVTATAAAGHCEGIAAAMTAAATGRPRGGMAPATAAMAAAARGLSCGSVAAPAAAVASATAVRSCTCRGCDRQRGNAGGEKDPGHKLSPLERLKRPVRRAVPTPKRMEPALYRTSVNLKLLGRSDS